MVPCCKKSHLEFRTVYLGNKLPPQVDATVQVQTFQSNRILSSRYTIWNFVPKNLFEQFHRVANLYFLVMAIIEFTIDSPTAPGTSLIPLCIVVTTSAVKQGYEDWLRHKADREVNNREAFVVKDGKCQQVRSMDLHVGDVIRVPDDANIPCDMVILSTSNSDGSCYITSANLDGETNLKMFSSVAKTKTLQTEDSLEPVRASIECQEPTTDLYQFIGRMNFFSGDDSVETVSLGPQNVLLRGARLKNTKFVYGCVIYTGQETKISLNSRYKSRKYSGVERKMNRFLLVMLLFLIIYSISWTGITMSFYFTSRHDGASLWYLYSPILHFQRDRGRDRANLIIQIFLAFMVLCKSVIPISMYVSIEFQKFVGSKFFDWDAKMYHAESGEPAKARTSDLNEELGQVEYLFTDKTGTLTRNEMRFRMCSCNGTVYKEVNDGQLYNTASSSVVPASDVMVLLASLALCHTVQVEKNRSANDAAVDAVRYEYQSSSPDEKALVEACSRLGLTYCGRRNDVDDLVELLANDGSRTCYVQHHVLDFDATRKRMSVIVQNVQDGSLWLICKGAETAVFERTTSGDIDLIERHINDFALLGLRTLVIARRQLTVDEFNSIDKMIKVAKSTLADREKEIFKVYDLVENNLSLVGATAVEDQLQEGVPETLRALTLAGIKVWVLTGDRLETAVNVSYAAGHFASGSSPFSITHKKTSEECAETIEQIHAWLSCKENSQRANLVIDGKSLTFALQDHQRRFRSICQQCRAVLCCRLSPIQKAMVVKMIKQSEDKPTVAAIGDGANDVSMIQEAHVGLAIFGKEGWQAVRASDYAFAQFAFLQRVFLVHGFYYYTRLSNLVQYFFYKNIAVVVSQVFFTFFNGFSAQSLYDNYYLTMFNTVFTALPIIVYGLMEKNVSAAYLLKHPEYYRTIRRNKLLSTVNFICWCFLGVWHAAVMFFGAYLATYHGNSLKADGKGIGVYDFGTMIMTTCVITVNVKLMLVTYSFNGLLIACFVLTIGAYFVATLIYNVVIWRAWSSHLFHSMTTLLSTPSVWLLIVLLVVASVIPDIVIRTLTDSFSLAYRHRRFAKTVQKNKYNVSPEISVVSYSSRNGGVVSYSLSSLDIADDTVTMDSGIGLSRSTLADAVPEGVSVALEDTQNSSGSSGR